jgi:GLPGLI family protein
MCRTANEESVIEGGNGGMVFKMHRPQNELYTNLKMGRSTNSQEFMGKKFLIKADVTQLPWKVTGQMDQISWLQLPESNHDRHCARGRRTRNCSLVYE